MDGYSTLAHRSDGAETKHSNSLEDATKRLDDAETQEYGYINKIFYKCGQKINIVRLCMDLGNVGAD